MPYRIEDKNGYKLIRNEGGAELGVCSLGIIERDGFAFKDYDGSGELLPYADWRLPCEERARDLASRLSIEQIAGLMLYSSHQSVPAVVTPGFPVNKDFLYSGKLYSESGAQPDDLSDGQKDMLEHNDIRHVLVTRVQSPEISAKWANNLQRMAESLPHSIPVNISTDPRHGVSNGSEEYKTDSRDVSKWPEGLGMAALFSPDACRRFGDVAAKEYRALGIHTALSPQVDLGTEPRWLRFADTFGGCVELTTDLSRAYCDGMQTTEDSDTGWGKDSVVAMAKHWPGGGPCEGGRDAHYRFGKFAVWPGGKQADHLKPFTEGAFKLNGKTGCAGAVMPYYTVSWGYDKYGDNVGNSYSKYIIGDLLRGEYGYDGVICTDWGITGDPEHEVDSFGARPYGVEHLSVAERHLRIIMNGVDQFGGNNDSAPIIEAYRLGCERFGEAAMRERFEQSAVRLLLGSMRLGLFENPYIDPQESARVAACKEFVDEGFAAQVRSIVMLKNKGGVLPFSRRMKLYIPQRCIKAHKNFFRFMAPERTFTPISESVASEYFDIVSDPAQADAALVMINSPISDPYSKADREAGGNGYLPVSLQYRPYTADAAREHSIAGGDISEPFDDRSYHGKTVHTANESDLDNIIEARNLMGTKPVIVCAHLSNAVVPAEFEQYADAILCEFGVEHRAIFDILTGQAEPSALLPLNLPESMETVERHCEDIADDITPYTDSEGNTYRFGFGLDWSGVIEDERKKKYAR